jgi:predicted aldo/keto reductase-like oxidoreductase
MPDKGKDALMERIVLGRTGLQINRFGFGGIPIQTVSESQAVDTVRHAVETGVDFIDTSRGYTTSERRIGMALKEIGKPVVLASKTRAHTAGEARADLETSLSELQRTSVDLYQCHFVRDMDDYRERTGKGGALEALQRAREEGLVGHVGITAHRLEVLDRALDDGLFDTIMCCFSFLEPSAKEALIPKALEKNVGVIAMKSFSGGVIDDPAAAIKWALAQPGVAIIPGVESRELFDANWAVYASGNLELTEAERAVIASLRERYDKAFCRRCDYCQPCSEDIPISVVLHLRSIVRRMGDAALEQGWLAAGIEAARRCSRCEECLERCPYELPIPDLIQETLEWLDR